jgi:hypothetical protein
MAVIHALYRITSFRMVGRYKLRVTFDDGAIQTVDLEPVLRGNIYGPLRDEAIFNQVRLDREVHTLIWPNGADFDPATLHDWPQLAEAWITRAQQWEERTHAESST